MGHSARPTNCAFCAIMPVPYLLVGAREVERMATGLDTGRSEDGQGWHGSPSAVALGAAARKATTHDSAHGHSTRNAIHEGCGGMFRLLGHGPGPLGRNVLRSA